MRGRGLGRTVLVSAVAVLAGGMTLAAVPVASAAPQSPSASSATVQAPGGHPMGLLASPRAVPLPADERAVCPRSSLPGQMECQAVLRVPRRGSARAALAFASAALSIPGYGPSSLRSAYGLASASATRGRREVIAVVDAYNDPYLARNLASYRSHFGLPVCSVASGCLRIVNQAGHARPLPKSNISWGIEESTDLDMVSALCPLCHILLVEAASSSISALAAAENTAVAKGARFVSNSWGGVEFYGQDAYNHYFNHPGDAIVFAGGDSGYGAQYPADTQYVTSVGGTTLLHKRSGSRAWTERVWGNATSGVGSGSGCSTLEAKPSWQRDNGKATQDGATTGCLNRTQNDVAAVADPNTGVLVYDSYGTGATWGEIGGTSVATPIITATYALAGYPARGSYPASYPYAHASKFYDVTSGENGTCESDRQYLCHGVRGYNGPTGLGTPKGTAGFASGGARPVSVADPGTQDVGVGAGFSLTLHAVDTDTAAKSLAYRATGLPKGLTIGSAGHSLNGTLSGTLPSSPGSYHITVTAKDGRTKRSASVHFSLYVVPSLTVPSSDAAAPAEVVADEGTSCLSAASETIGTSVQMEACGSSGFSQLWQHSADKSPGAPGILTIASGVCLGLNGSKQAVLQNCSGSASQQWEYLPSTNNGNPASAFFNPSTGDCLDGGALTADTVVAASACTSASGEAWTLNQSVVVSGLPGLCLSATTSTALASACDGSSAEQWHTYGGLFSSASGCLAESNLNDGTQVSYEPCSTAASTANGFWFPGPGGELINAASGKCLDAGGNGDTLVQEDCYGLPGEVWAIN